MKRQLYLVLMDWSTNDSDGINTFLYEKFEDAREKFRALIKDEHNPDISWVGGCFDENGEPLDGYDLECNDDGDKKDLYWRFVDIADYNRHTFIDLKIMEVL